MQTRLVVVQPADELVVLHAGGEEEVAPQVRIGSLSQKRNIVLPDGVLDLRFERIARQNLVAVATVLDCSRRGSQAEAPPRLPVVGQSAVRSAAVPRSSG